jgi:hypothetical protein
VVQMKDVLPFLNTTPRLQLCTLRCKYTKKHVSNFDTVVRRLKGKGDATRRYIYAEGCVNLSLHPHSGLDGSQRLLSVKRECACGAVGWLETVTAKDLEDRTVHLTFTAQSTEHKDVCVAPGATERSQPLVGQYVYVKELALDRTNTASKIEVGSAHFDQHANDVSVVSDLAQHGKDLDLGFIQNTLKHARASGRGHGGEGDFDLIHSRIVNVLAPPTNSFFARPMSLALNVSFAVSNRSATAGTLLPLKSTAFLKIVLVRPHHMATPEIRKRVTL